MTKNGESACGTVAVGQSPITAQPGPDTCNVLDLNQSDLITMLERREGTDFAYIPDGGGLLKFFVEPKLRHSS